jgi:hypothetical protein
MPHLFALLPFLCPTQLRDLGTECKGRALSWGIDSAQPIGECSVPAIIAATANVLGGRRAGCRVARFIVWRVHPRRAQTLCSKFNPEKSGVGLLGAATFLPSRHIVTRFRRGNGVFSSLHLSRHSPAAGHRMRPGGTIRIRPVLCYVRMPKTKTSRSSLQLSPTCSPDSA